MVDVIDFMVATLLSQIFIFENIEVHLYVYSNLIHNIFVKDFFCELLYISLPSLGKPHYVLFPKLLKLTCKMFIKMRFYFVYVFETVTIKRIKKLSNGSRSGEYGE